MSDTSLSLSRRSFLAGGAATGAFIILHPFSAHAQANQAHLRIMETTDIHVNVLPYDYYADKPNDTMGLSRTASLIDAVRKEAANSMLVDNGDLLQGNPMGDFIAYEKGMKEGDVHPVMKGMNLLGYDVSTLGNHEFNYGLSFMDKVLAGANFPVRLRQSGARHRTCRQSARRQALSQALRDDRQDDQGRLRRRASDQDRRDRLRAAADHALGRQEPRRQRRDPRYRRGRESLGAADQGGGSGYRHRALAFRHRRPAGRHDGERIVLPGRRRGHRCGVHRPPASGVSGQEGFPGPRRRRRQGRHAARQAGRNGRLLGLAYGADRSPA